ncbi:MAG: hypothetical protein M3R64_09360 [Pseudomonadota bacterium]|nr:hypothetical protein [Pseudomonadota bacterium]
MTIAPDQRFCVVPLSVQREGDDFLVGSAELEEFVQLPDEGVRILTMLREGTSVPKIAAAFAPDDGAGGTAIGETIDVEDFLASMIEIGFVYPEGQADRHAERLANAPADRRLVFRANRRVAAAIFSLPSLVVYLLIVGTAIAAAIRYPEARIQTDAFFVDNHLAATLVLLLILSSGTTALHELGHMLAAAAHGVVSRLGFGMRLWFVVAEADLSGTMALPKRQRYVPLAAGMMVDVLNIALITIAVTMLLRHGVHGFAVALLQALALQLIVTLLWQFNIFLRTDVYFILCTWFGHPDLDRDARVYLGAILSRVSLGRLGRPVGAHVFKSLAMVRAFAAVWVIGRIAALAMLVLVVLPTLGRYGLKAYRAFADPAATRATAYDLGIFVILSLLLVAAGLILWLRNRPRSTFGEDR